LRADTLDFIEESAHLALPRADAACAIDRRVQGALVRLRSDADQSLDEVAREARLSLNRLSRLVTQGTGMRLRQHVLWNRLLAVLSATRRFDGIAAAACAAGFADLGCRVARSTRSPGIGEGAASRQEPHPSRNERRLVR
jgi:AraC-like DNA-binding protein